jgi:hypothetical protein
MALCFGFFDKDALLISRVKDIMGENLNASCEDTVQLPVLFSEIKTS